MDDCEARYANYTRGADCYCSPHHGCFHKHFHVKPRVIHASHIQGLIPGKEQGRHDSDYFVEVTVINTAQLVAVECIKVC